MKFPEYIINYIKSCLDKRNHYNEKYAKQYMNEEVKNVSLALDAISDTVSLSDPVFTNKGENVRIMDQIADTKYDVDSIVEKFALKDALENLSEREKEIIMLRYYIGKTQMEVSKEIGMSQAQVSRLEKNALENIRKKIT